MTDPDLPSTIDDLTAEMARNAPAGVWTDRIILYVMGWRLDWLDTEEGPSARWLDPDGFPHYIGVRDDGTPQIPDGAEHMPSRTPEGAYRAREWLRGRVPPSYDLFGIIEMAVRKWDVDEHLATARVLLQFYAEGVLS